MTSETEASKGRSLLEMRGIGKHFAGIAALSDASLSVSAGEVHALIGQNGAGKSTLIKVLTGYHRKDAGEVLFEGRPCEVGSPHQAQASGISTIYQEINLVPLRSVTENICLGREKRRFGLLDWKAMHEEAERLLTRFSIRIDVRRPLGDYNTATQQMVAIARALMARPKLLLLAEPSLGLAPLIVKSIFEAIKKLNKEEGLTVFLVEQNAFAALKLSDRAYVMVNGRVTMSGSGQELLANPEVRAAYLEGGRH